MHIHHKYKVPTTNLLVICKTRDWWHFQSNYPIPVLLHDHTGKLNHEWLQWPCHLMLLRKHFEAAKVTTKNEPSLPNYFSQNVACLKCMLSTHDPMTFSFSEALQHELIRCSLPPSSCISAVISWFGSSNSIILQTPVLVQLRMICKFIFMVKKQKKKGKERKITQEH